MNYEMIVVFSHCFSGEWAGELKKRIVTSSIEKNENFENEVSSCLEKFVEDMKQCNDYFEVAFEVVARNYKGGIYFRRTTKVSGFSDDSTYSNRLDRDNPLHPEHGTLEFEKVFKLFLESYNYFQKIQK